MTDRTESAEADPQSSLAEELAAIPYEPLLPAEKWLIGVSLFLGVALLAIVSWAGPTFFPVPPTATSAGPNAADSQPKPSATHR